MSRVEHIEFIVEEPSMEEFLRGLLPQMVGGLSYAIHPFQGKAELLQRLPDRLRGYAAWLPANCRIVVVVDCDDDNCAVLKAQLEQWAYHVGLGTRSRPVADRFMVVNRIAVEELEAWYFGDWAAVRTAYPRLPATVPHQAGFRDPDAVPGGTWEAFERLLQRAGYFRGGLRKIEAARVIAPYMTPDQNISRSFQVFRDGVLNLVVAG